MRGLRASRGAWLAGLSGFNEQIFGVNEQILVRADPQRPKNNSRVLHEWSGTFIRSLEGNSCSRCAAEVVHDGVEAEPASLAQSSELLAWPSLLPCIGGTGEK